MPAYELVKNLNTLLFPHSAPSVLVPFLLDGQVINKGTAYTYSRDKLNHNSRNYVLNNNQDIDGRTKGPLWQCVWSWDIMSWQLRYCLSWNEDCGSSQLNTRSALLKLKEFFAFHTLDFCQGSGKCCRRVGLPLWCLSYVVRVDGRWISRGLIMFHRWYHAVSLKVSEYVIQVGCFLHPH